MLIRFCATTVRADVEATAAGPGFLSVPLDLLPAPLRFAFWDVVFAAMAFPGDSGSGRFAA